MEEAEVPEFITGQNATIQISMGLEGLIPSMGAVPPKDGHQTLSRKLKNRDGRRCWKKTHIQFGKSAGETSPHRLHSAGKAH